MLADLLRMSDSPRAALEPLQAPPTPTSTPTPTPKPPEAARLRRVAVFYSISSPFDGLRGVPLGRLLIKRVVEELER